MGKIIWYSDNEKEKKKPTEEQYKKIKSMILNAFEENNFWTITNLKKRLNIKMSFKSNGDYVALMNLLNYLVRSKKLRFGYVDNITYKTPCYQKL